MRKELIRGSQIKHFSSLVHDTRQYLKVNILFQYRNGKNKNIKDANNMCANTRDLLKIEKYLGGGEGGTW